MIDRVLREAGLERPAGVEMVSGGRQGRHTLHLTPMLAEMHVLARAMPDAKW